MITYDRPTLVCHPHPLPSLIEINCQNQQGANGIVLWLHH